MAGHAPLFEPSRGPTHRGRWRGCPRRRAGRPRSPRPRCAPSASRSPCPRASARPARPARRAARSGHRPAVSVFVLSAIKIPLALAVAAGVVLTVAVGALVERLALRPRRDAGPLTPILIQIGVELLLGSVAR